MRKLSFPKLINKSRAVWITTIVLSSMFFALAVPRSVSYATQDDSAGAIYLWHKDETAKEAGFMPNLANSMVCMLSGCGDKTDTAWTASDSNGSVLGTLGDIGDSFYENPTGSAIIWAQDQYNLATGQGSFRAFAYNPNDTDVYYVSGYAALEGTIGLWNWSRNIVYALFIIILVAVAFMILFRRSLGGQQYVTLTNSLPSIVLSLVLVTFSYPISAVFIDAVSIGCNLAYNIIIAAPNAPGHNLVAEINAGSGTYYEVPRIEEQKDLDYKITVSGTVTVTKVDGQVFKDSVPVKQVLQPDDPQMSLWSIFWSSNAQVCGSIPIGIGKLTDEATAESCNFSKYMVPSAVYSPISQTINAVLTALTSIGAENVLIELALIILIITTQLKILKRLISDYMILSFFPILSPWVFLVAALPNRTSKMLTDYAKILGWSAANMVIIYACFLILIVLGYTTAKPIALENSTPEIPTFQLSDSFKASSQLKWVPPMLGYSYGQIIGNNSTSSNTQVITTLIIVFFFMAIPRIPEEIQSWLSVPQLPPLLRNTGQDVGSGIKQAAGYASGGIGTIVSNRFGKNKGQ